MNYKKDDRVKIANGQPGTVQSVSNDGKLVNVLLDFNSETVYKKPAELQPLEEPVQPGNTSPKADDGQTTKKAPIKKRTTKKAAKAKDGAKA